MDYKGLKIHNIFRSDLKYYVTKWVISRYAHQNKIEYSYQLADAMQNILTKGIPVATKTLFAIIYVEGAKKCHYFVHYYNELYTFNKGPINISSDSTCIPTLFTAMTGEKASKIQYIYYNFREESDILKQLNQLCSDSAKQINSDLFRAISPPPAAFSSLIDAIELFETEDSKTREKNDLIKEILPKNHGLPVINNSQGKSTIGPEGFCQAGTDILRPIPKRCEF